jgi:hypothetical protein
MRTRWIALFVALLSLLVPVLGQAQSFPSKPIRLVVPIRPVAPPT